MIYIYIILGKSFIVKHYYDMHMATHSDVDLNQLPYICDICKKRFASSQFLATHQISHQTKVYINNLEQKSSINKSQNKASIRLLNCKFVLLHKSIFILFHIDVYFVITKRCLLKIPLNYIYLNMISISNIIYGIYF